jgi:hypothetical protein
LDESSRSGFGEGWIRAIAVAVIRFAAKGK